MDSSWDEELEEAVRVLAVASNKGVIDGGWGAESKGISHDNDKEHENYSKDPSFDYSEEQN